MLRIHILNVRHGDSIIIQYDGPSGTSFGVIDSNITKDDPCPALTKLKEIGAKELSFVALTHPDTDHCSGLSRIISHYKGRIRTFYSFPFGAHLQGRLKEFAKIYKQLYVRAGEESIRKKIRELIDIICLVKEYIGLKNWEEPNGYFNQIAPFGFEGLEMFILLPLPKIKGAYFEMIKAGDFDVSAQKNTNKLSLAFYIRYKGKEIILGGDAQEKIWYEHEKFCQRASKQLLGNAVKLPHHGADKDNSDKVLSHLFGRGDGNLALISANGFSHPSKGTLQRLKEKAISAYCTNLSKHCVNIRRPEFSIGREIDARLARFLISHQTDQHIQACQGDITVEISGQGELSISRQYDNACFIRGDFDFLTAG